MFIQIIETFNLLQTVRLYGPASKFFLKGRDISKKKTRQISTGARKNRDAKAPLFLIYLNNLI